MRWTAVGALVGSTREAITKTFDRETFDRETFDEYLDYTLRDGRISSIRPNVISVNKAEQEQGGGVGPKRCRR